MKTKGSSALAVVAILLAAVLAPAMGLSLMNNSNSSFNFNENLNDSITNPDHDHDPETSTPTPSPPVDESDNNATDTDTEANETEIIDDEISLPPLSENLMFIGKDSFGANETPEFVIEIEQDFIDAIADVSDGEAKHFDQTFLKFVVEVQFHVEGCEGNKNRLDLFVEEEETSPSSNITIYRVTIPNNKTGLETEELTPGIYTLVVEVGEQSVEHSFKWGLEPEPTYVELQPQNLTVNITTKPILTAKKKHFVLNENPTFKFKFNYKTKNESKAKAKTNETGLKPLVLAISEPRKALKTWVTSEETIKTSVYYKDELVDIEPEIEKIGEGDFSIKIPSQRAFRAGSYKLKVELVTDNKTYVEEQDFTWGVLAINTHKSIYLPDETAFIGMAVLDDEGHMVCDADVTLTITDPDNKETVLSTSNGLIKVSPECCVYGVTNLPDYYTNYVVGGVGTYVMTLTAVTPDGTKSITDEFVVQSSVDFDVARSGPTRIYPPVPYVMNFTIKANKNYNGLIKEYVPALFEIAPQDGLTVSTIGDTKQLSWTVKLKKNDIINLYYEFDAPNISPYLFVLGALEIGNWQEARQWMIASDPAGTVKDDSVTASGDKDYNSNEQFTIAVVFHIESAGGTRTADFNMQLRYGDNTTEGDDATTPLTSASCPSQDFKFVSVDTSDCDAKGYCTLTDNGDGTVRVEFTDDPTGNSVTITWTVEVCPGATTGSYDIDDHAPSATTGDITLDDWDTISVTQLIPPKTNETSVNATTVGVNDIICVNHTVTKGTYDIDKTWIEITYPNGTSANITTSNTTGVCGAGGNVYGVEINVGSTTGNLTVNTSWVNDTHGNIDYDDPYPNNIVSVKDLKTPHWSDPNTNKTTIYEGDYVKFTANWTDDVALAGYKFAINQTGTWVNSSFTSFSGTSNTSENITQITASVGTTVGWRFYANDTSDNGNATDIQTFMVESAEVITPVTPFMIYGRVFYEDGSECNNSLVVNITNLNTSKQWTAKTNASYNYYRRILANGTDLNASEILQFNVSDGFRYNVTNHTVTQENITNGGLFSFNLTLPTPPSPSTPFIIYGWVNYSNGTACNGPTVNITNTNTSVEWQAETNASYNYYQLVLDTLNVSTGNVLLFNATDGAQFNVTNHTVTQDDINNGGLFNFNLTLPSAADTTPPEWRNQGQSVSQIPVGGSILLYVQGKDTVALDYAILATNETGTWHNWTGKYGSPMDMQDAVNTWKWSNFTWQNGSISAGTTVGWRIWYNDTANNWNKTDIMCFEVIAGAPPTVDSITITPDDEPAKDGVQVNPTPGANKTVNISAVVSDPNGWNTINTVVANITGPSTVADSPVTLFFVSNSTLMTATYNGTFNMSFYYLNGTYTVDVTATDNGSLTGSNSTTFEYQTAIALELDSSVINFSSSGPIDPGETSEVLGDKNMSTLNNATVRNIGNVIIDVGVNGTNMCTDFPTCSGSVITKDNIGARINETSYQDMSVTRCFDVNMSVGFSSLNNTDFRLYVPYGTPQGNYSGTITLTAVHS